MDIVTLWYILVLYIVNSNITVWHIVYVYEKNDCLYQEKFHIEIGREEYAIMLHWGLQSLSCCSIVIHLQFNIPLNLENEKVNGGLNVFPLLG